MATLSELLRKKKQPSLSQLLAQQRGMVPPSAPKPGAALPPGLSIGGQTTAQTMGGQRFNQAPQGAAGILPGLIVGAVQAPFKATGALLAGAEQAITGKPTTFQPAVPALFGNEPISSVQTQTEETYGGLRSMGYSPVQAGTVTGLGVIGAMALDLAPFGGSSKNAARAIVGVKSAQEAATLGRNLGLEGSLLQNFIDDVPGILKQADAQRYIDNLQETLKTTKPVNTVNVANTTAPGQAQAWPTTASKPSKAGVTSTGSAPIGKEGVSALKADTSGPFEGGKDYKHVAEMYQNGEDFYQRMPEEVRDGLRAQGIKGEEQVTAYWEKVTGKKSETGYQMTHRPREDGPRAFDLTESDVIPKDMYKQWYGAGRDTASQESIAALKAVKGKPDADITVYRASPKPDFNEGDWVTLSESYAKSHAEGQGGKVYSRVVKAKDLRWATDDINEFGYFPSKSSPSIPKELEPLAAEARKYPTIHEGGTVKMVEGEPVKIIDGVETFIHKGDGGWVVSEASTGKYLGDSRTKEGAIAKASFNISNVGEDKFRQLIAENKLPEATGGTPKGDRPFDAGATPAPRQSQSPQPQRSAPAPTPSQGAGGPPTPPPKSSSYADNVPQGGNAVQKVIQALKEAKPLNKEQAAIYRAERAKRTAAVANMRAKGEAGFFKQLGALKGEMPKVQFEALRKNLKQEDIDELFDMVEANTKILPLEKISAKAALSKILTGSVPTRSELELLAEIFPKDFIKAILDKRDIWAKLFDVAGEVLNIPRSLMATMDVSAPLRQGIFMIGRPKQWAPAFAQMFKYLVSEKAYQKMLDDIEARPTYPKMREAKLALMDTANETLTKREEAFMSNLAERIPFLGRPIKASGRAYTGFLTKLRADVFDDLYRQSKALNIDDPDLNIAIARYVNSATGRGDLGRFNRAAVILNATFFSPRLMASRLNLLNPIFYANLPPFVRKQAIRDLLVFSGVAASVLGLSKLAGAEVETDPTSADFAKAKFGNTRYDVLGGFQQYIRLANQLVQGRIKSSTTGREITLGEGYKPLTRKDILIRFFESKESPILSFATALMTGKDTQGRDISVPNEIVSRAIPLVVQDIYDIYQDKGLEGLVWWLPAPFGVGSQTYGKTELVEGQNPIGQPTAQVRPLPDLSSTIVEKLMGKQPLGNSKNFDVEVYFDQLMAMGPEKAKETLKHIAEVNEDLAKQIIQVKKDRDAGITPHDRDLKDMGVKSGDRAMAIIEDLEKLDTPEEKKALLRDMEKKGILTEDVWEQVKLLLGGKQSKADPLTNVVAALTGAKTAQAAELSTKSTVTKTASGNDVRTVPDAWKPLIATAYQKHPALKKYQGIIETVLMQESSMGTNDTNYNPSIGESAWLVGGTKVMKEELKRYGITADLDTQAGVINAVADYLDIKRTLKREDGSTVEYQDPVKLYLQRYKTVAGAKLSEAQTAKLSDFIQFYKTQ